MTDELTDAEKAKADAFYEEIAGELTDLVAEELARTRKEQRAKYPPGMTGPFDLSTQEIGWLITHVASYVAVRMRITLAADTRIIVAEELAKRSRGAL